MRSSGFFLDSILFLLYINDLAKNILSIGYIYTDDEKLYWCPSKNLNDHSLATDLFSDLASLTEQPFIAKQQKFRERSVRMERY